MRTGHPCQQRNLHVKKIQEEVAGAIQLFLVSVNLTAINMILAAFYSCLMSFFYIFIVIIFPSFGIFRITVRTHNKKYGFVHSS